MYDKQLLEQKKKIDKLLAPRTQEYKQGYAQAIDDFANWLEDKGYLRDDEIDYDWEENSIRNTYYMTAEEVVEEYKEQLKKE